MTIYLIFSQEGFTEVQCNIINDKATLWINKDFLSNEQLAELEKQNIELHTFAEFVDGSNDKAIMQAVHPLEKQFPNVKILVEYL